MRKYLLFFLVLFLPLLSCTDDLILNVISFNIRYDNPSDNNNAWKYRKDLVVDFLDVKHPDIFGLQEALWHQYKYIDTLLIDYSSLGAGRDNGMQEGELAPVFYNKRRFELRDSDTFWLSETPELPGSKGWGAVLPRIVTWVKLFDRGSNTEFFFFNTHYSHMSDSARLMSSMILYEQVNSIAGDAFFVITGDFNMKPDSEAYMALTRGDNNPIKDTWHLSENEPSGPNSTFNGFREISGGSRIDYIFARGGVEVVSHSTIYKKREGIFISDHWPVFTTLSWQF